MSLNWRNLRDLLKRLATTNDDLKQALKRHHRIDASAQNRESIAKAIYEGARGDQKALAILADLVWRFAPKAAKPKLRKAIETGEVTASRRDPRLIKVLAKSPKARELLTALAGVSGAKAERHAPIATVEESQAQSSVGGTPRVEPAVVAGAAYSSITETSPREKIVEVDEAVTGRAGPAAGEAVAKPRLAGWQGDPVAAKKLLEEWKQYTGHEQKALIRRWIRDAQFTNGERRMLASQLGLHIKVGATPARLATSIYGKVPVDRFEKVLAGQLRAQEFRNRDRFLNSLAVLSEITNSIIPDEFLDEHYPPASFRQNVDKLLVETKTEIGTHYRNVNESEVAQKFLRDLLDVLGWEKGDWRPEAPMRKGKGRVDFLVNTNQINPAFIIEVKKPSIDLLDREWKQGVKYTKGIATEWFVLTNGLRLDLCHRVTEKVSLFIVDFFDRDWRLDDIDLRRLFLLSKKSVQNRWHEKALENALGPNLRLLEHR